DPGIKRAASIRAPCPVSKDADPTIPAASCGGLSTRRVSPPTRPRGSPHAGENPRQPRGFHGRPRHLEIHSGCGRREIVQLERRVKKQFMSDHQIVDDVKNVRQMRCWEHPHSWHRDDELCADRSGTAVQSSSRRWAPRNLHPCRWTISASSYVPGATETNSPSTS